MLRELCVNALINSTIISKISLKIMNYTSSNVFAISDAHFGNSFPLGGRAFASLNRMAGTDSSFPLIFVLPAYKCKYLE
jgi:hypothetical protein